jgi:hypothetical protein
LYIYNMMKELPGELIQAAREYCWLLSRKYPQGPSLKLVGDKFMLSRDMRQVLYRGIGPEEKAASRKQRIGPVPPEGRVLVDTYNVLFTINNYLLGRPLFISNDGLLRDAGEMRGRVVNKAAFNRSVKLLLDGLKEWKGCTFVLYLDEPVSHSGELSSRLNRELSGTGIRGEALTVRSPDQMLIQEKSDAICTSDTAIIDQYPGQVIDLPNHLLKKHYQAQFPLLIL